MYSVKLFVSFQRREKPEKKLVENKALISSVLFIYNFARKKNPPNIITYTRKTELLKLNGISQSKTINGYGI